jgi:hypothetical protein
LCALGPEVLLPEMDPADTLVQEPEHPERHLIVKRVLNTVLDYVPLFGFFDLLFPFFAASYLEGLSFDFKVGYRRFECFVFLFCPAEEYGLA